MSIRIGARSRAKGVTNEDASLVDADHCLFGVFDGLGGTRHGGHAARLAAATIRAAYDAHVPADDWATERASLMRAVEEAGRLIATDLQDGLTTASVVHVCGGPARPAAALICNIGDSRVYRYTSAGELHQCTLDDSIFGVDWDLQQQLSDVTAPTGLLEHTYFQLRHVMDRALGERDGSPHLWEVPAEDGDVLLAVTDGVTDNLTFSELRRLLSTDPGEPQQIARRIVDAAHDRSRQSSHPRAKVDDITAVAAVVRSAG